MFIGWAVDSFHNVVKDLEREKLVEETGRAERNVLIENEGSEGKKKWNKGQKKEDILE